MLLTIMGVLTIGLFGCGSSGSGETVKIVATDNNWDSQKIHNAIAEIVVEHAYDGYEFDVSTASSTMNWQSIIKGDVDLDIESWTDNVATYEKDVKKGDIVDVGILVPDSRQGIYVPRYVVEGDKERGIEPMAPGLKTVKDLEKYADVFPDDENPSMGRLYGSIPGWMADEILYKKYQAYGLDQSFVYTRLGGEAALFSSLVSAYNRGEAWAGYCYEPTWIAGKLDLILLEDEPYDEKTYLDGMCAFPTQKLKTVSSKYFAEKAPELVSFFEKYQTGSKRIGEALTYLDESKASYPEVAIWFLKKNDKLLDEWLSSENAEMLRGYLAEQN